MAWYNIFGGGIVESLEKVALEMIDTDMEKAEATSLKLKVLDPNGKMRRDISNKISSMYVVYIAITMILVISQSFGLGDTEGTREAINSLTELFVPITTMFTMIVGASFGTNMTNTMKGR